MRLWHRYVLRHPQKVDTYVGMGRERVTQCSCGRKWRKTLRPWGMP